MKRVVIAAGGTAGHVVPALAVAAALQARGADVEFVGGDRAEARLVPAAGFPLHRLRVEGLDRRSPARAARALALAGAAGARARRLLSRLRADAVIGAGGYVSGPVAAAASTLRLPVFLLEADSHMGVTNRALAPLAQRIFLAFPIDGRTGDRYLVTGRPVPAAVLSADRAAARARFDLATDQPCLLVFGGSLGARTINRAAIDAFGETAPCAVLHVSGERDHAEVASRLEALGSPPHYRLRSYVEPFADALAAADLVVARSGGSVFELAAAGLPAILVPYPHATGDHQTLNARWLTDGEAAVTIADGELDGPHLAREVGDLLSSPGRLRAMGDAALKLARPDAADRIADEVLGAL